MPTSKIKASLVVKSFVILLALSDLQVLPEAFAVSSRRGHAVTLVVHHIDRARAYTGLQEPRGDPRERGRGRHLLLRRVQGVVAEREGHTVVRVVHHAVDALCALLDLGVSRGDRLVEAAFFERRKHVVVAVRCGVTGRSRRERELVRGEGGRLS